MSFQNPLPPGIRQVVPDYVSDGVTLAWGFPFRLWFPADLYVGVSANGGQSWTQLTLGVNYTITIESTSAALVTLTAAQPIGNLIRLEGLATPQRTTSVVNDGVVQSAPLESELDYQVAIEQELRRDINAEATRAEAAEAAETVRAEAAEATLNASVAQLQGLVSAAISSWLSGSLTLPTVEPTGSGLFWNNGGVVCVTAGGVNPLPTVQPLAHGIFWNDGGVVCIS